MKKLILLSLLLDLSFLSISQTVTWSKYFDPSVDGELMNYLVKSDSGYLLGTDIFCTGSSWNGCLYLAKLDNLGNVTNSEYFNKSEDLAAIGICNGPKDEFKKGEKRLMCLGKKYLDDPKYYPVACFLDDSLKIIKWEDYKSQDTTQHIQINNMFSYDSFSVMVATSIRNKFDPNEVKPVLVIIDDTLGQVAQHKVKGLEEYRLLDNPSFVKLQDGTIACVSNVRLYGEGLTDDRHIAIMRFDTIGELLWKKIVNKSAYGNKNQYNTDIAQLAGGNIIFNGAGFVEFGNATYKQDIYPNYIQCINVKGDSLWQNTFSEDTTRKRIVVLQPLENGDILGGGYGFGLNWETLESTPYKGWLFCLSSDGKLKWERFYKNPKNLDEGVNIFRKLVICDDGGILVGTEGSDVKNKSGLWLLKLDSMGCLTPDCAGTELYTSVKDEKGNWKNLKEIFFSIYPNPAKEVVNIDFFSPQPGRKMELMVSDMNGVGLYRTEINNEKHVEQINVSGYKPGSYVVSLLMNGKVIQSEGMVKE
jgi:hypothetical protein